MDFNTDWIVNGINSNTIKWAESFAKNKLIVKYQHGRNKGKVNKEKSLTTSQIRKFFGEVKRIEALGYNNNKTDVLMLKPKLAYATGRKGDSNHPIHKFYKEVGKALDNVSNKDQFNNLVRLLEVIVAYHKAAGGGE